MATKPHVRVTLAAILSLCLIPLPFAVAGSLAELLLLYRHFMGPIERWDVEHSLTTGVTIGLSCIPFGFTLAVVWNPRRVWPPVVIALIAGLLIFAGVVLYAHQSRNYMWSL